MSDPRERLKCPWCGSHNVESDSVDIGVGLMSAGPLGCIDCHAFEITQDESMHDMDRPTEEEIRRGWWRGSV